MSRLGETIRAARLKKGLTPKALGKKCGVAESFINDVEMGTRIVSDDQAQRILKVLGVENPISTELEVAAEPEKKLRPKPRAYVLEPDPQPQSAAEEDRSRTESSDAWIDALSGVVKRVPVTDDTGLVIDHVLRPVVGGRIEGGAPDKVFFYRCPDDMLRGFRVYAGDLLLTVPAAKILDGAIMVFLVQDRRVARKATKLDGNRVLLQAFDHEFTSETLPLDSVKVLGACVSLERRL